jgi:hypothetical protein
MRRSVRFSIVLLLTLALGGASARTAESRVPDPSAAAPLAQSRMVVFETFMRPG